MQRTEREVLGKDYSKDYKPQRSKDDAKLRRKQILSSIGEDLLVASNDQPFRFPGRAGVSIKTKYLLRL